MKQETKPIQIDSKLHAELKQYCNEKGLKLQKLVEILIKEKLKKDGNSLPAF
jgi:hypothetical protein